MADLAQIWGALRRSEVFPAEPLHGLFGFMGRRRGLVPPTRLLDLIERHLTFDRLEDAPVPLHVVVTDVTALVHQRLADEVEHQASHGIDLRVVPPPCPITTSPADFSAGAQLVEAGYDVERAWLEHSSLGAGDVGLLRPHHHTAGSPLARQA